ncbi:MAG: hypothetical protein P8123_08335, partial [bacterium]
MRIVEDDATKQMAGRRRNPSGRCRLRRVSALLRPRRITLDTSSASRLDPLASGLRRGRAHYSDRLLSKRSAQRSRWVLIRYFGRSKAMDYAVFSHIIVSLHS